MTSIDSNSRSHDEQGFKGIAPQNDVPKGLIWGYIGVRDIAPNNGKSNGKEHGK